MTNKEKFLALVSKEDTGTIDKVKERIKNRAMLRESQQIAIKVLSKLDDLKKSQRWLAYQMGVTPQQVTKIVSGKENLTIETQIKLQTVLDIPILASYYEIEITRIEERVLTIEKRIDQILEQSNQAIGEYQETKIIEMKPFVFSEEYQYNKLATP